MVQRYNTNSRYYKNDIKKQKKTRHQKELEKKASKTKKKKHG